ncbi:hypothetical protein OHC33_010535 [Knufia fluminis]|uniref:Glucose-methanol-choline oxidoreductase N-terminal domain-containing protein n=1 Tax=Knufia fluminis TaxID=191047 RepID=A0AAN8I3M2_9EURO|nr:hypothetical protein OHC33_010535 [Knufia fluminis]
MSGGRCLGGSTSINGLAYGRGSSSIYDLWQLLGNPGWSWNDVVSFFKKSTSLAPSTTDVRYATYDVDAYSADGPVKLNYPGFFQPSSAAFVDGLAAQNITPVTVELNSGNNVGAKQEPLTIDAMFQRSSSFDNYYQQAKSRPNLKVLTLAAVRQIMISQNGPALAATGVVYMDQNTGMVMNATANKEVILSAGSIQTPQLLMLSGIGPSQELQKNGIDIMLDNPNIGANLEDHPYFSLIIRANPSASSSMFYNDISKLQQVEMEYTQNKSGPFTAPVGTAFGFEKISETELASLGASPEYLSTRANQAHVEYYYESVFYPTRPTPQYPPALNESFFSITAGIIAPASKGSITLQSSLIMDAPMIDPNYLTAEMDQKMAIRSFRQLRKLLSDPSLQQYALGPNYGEVAPGPSVDSDEEILDYIRTTAVTVWHASGTCAMLPRGSGGVVDSNLKVYGVDGLRIVDASIMPVIPDQHTMAAVYMIAEKAAAMIKQEYGF